MDHVVLLLQIALASVLTVAAAGKLRDLPGSRQAVRDFGVPVSLAPALGTALPLVELLLAVLLLPGATARWAAGATALLFLVFVTVIAWNLRAGRRPDCHCFGRMHSEPASWRTVVRNTILTVAALAVVWHGGVGPAAWLDRRSDAATFALAVTAAILVIGAVQTWLLLQLIAQNGRILLRLDALEASPIARDPGTARDVTRAAPQFDIPALDGSRMSLQSLIASRKPVLLLFADPGCGPCRALTPDIAEWQRRFADDLTVAVISRGSIEENAEKFGALGVTHIGIQDAWEVYEAYGVQGTPSGVLVHSDGQIQDAFAPGRDSIRELVSRITSGHETSTESETSLDPGSDEPNNMLRLLNVKGVEPGTPGSRLPLPALDGGYASLDDYRGAEAVVLFWSPTCGFCERMLPDLREWEEEAGELTARVLVISSGDPGANREMQLRSRVVLDDGFTSGKAFGASGTPSAVLLDAEGKVASPVAVGADAVLDLLDTQLEATSSTG